MPFINTGRGLKCIPKAHADIMASDPERGWNGLFTWQTVFLLGADAQSVGVPALVKLVLLKLYFVRYLWVLGSKCEGADLWQLLGTTN